MSRSLGLLGVVLCLSVWLGLQRAPVGDHPGESLSAAEKAPPRKRVKRPVFDLKSSTPAEERIQAALGEETETGFVDTPLKEAISFLSELHGIEILIDEAALNEEGLSADEPINLDVGGRKDREKGKSITLRSVLRIMLEPLQLTYVIDNEVMMITTVTKGEEKLETRVYDVRKLAKVNIDSEHLAEVVERIIGVGPSQSLKASVVFSSDGKTLTSLNDMTSDTLTPNVKAVAQKAVEVSNGELRVQLSDATGKPVRRTTLKQVPAGAVPTVVAALPGCLVVKHTQRGHEEIADLLAQLQRLTEAGGDD